MFKVQLGCIDLKECSYPDLNPFLDDVLKDFKVLNDRNSELGIANEQISNEKNIATEVSVFSLHLIDSEAMYFL